MTALTLDDFGAYFEAVHGHEPFPWQTRLMQHVAEHGWPAALDLPTGSGKTAALDIALFHLALDAARPASERRAARRIFLIVDRRLIVDQAYERAERIREKLTAADGGVLARVAEALRGLTAGDTPLVTALLRGGLPRDGAWARTPDQPVLGVSTVDQVGSRLLFRGYGVSDSMRPIEAGLLGHDTLFLLDEVHLAQPFARTLEALRRYREHPGTLPARAEVVALSATPRDKAQVAFSLDAEDRAADALSQRLRASKPAELHAAKVKGEEDARRALFAHACAAHARRLSDDGAHTVAVIVNRVDTAQRVFRLLRDEHGLAPLPRDGVTADAGATAPQVALLTGRMRPLDRDARQQMLAARVGAGRDDDKPRNVGAPLIVVATQCLEAGADYDFDALVTECASLDALRQRFGRLDRLGRHGNARGVIVARDDELKDDADDPIYGTALKATWRWLDAHKPLDFGFERLPEPDDATRKGLLAPARDAPVLLPAHLDAWVQTSPPGPPHDPDVALWLHGPETEPPDVQVVWRADLDADALRAGSHVRPTRAERGEIDDRAAALLELCPPRSREALPLPLHAARRWLRGQPPADVADVEGALARDDDDARGPKAVRRERTALRFRRGKAEPVSWFELSPGDLLIVPSSYGGLDPESDTWDPGSREPVRDLGDLAQVSEQRRAVLRLTPAYLDAWGLHGAPPRDEDESDAEWKERLREWLARVPPSTGLEEVLKRFRDERDWRTSGEALVATRTKDDDRKAKAESALSLDPEVSSFTEVEVTLERHCEDVRKRARDFAERCGLPAAIVDDIALAAWLHDLGKADPRFQSWLRNDVVPATQNLAKSSLGPHDRRAREAALKLSGYPRGGRHELLSVALIDDSPALKDAHDRDLVLHLVASHHGHARPFVPYAPDPAPREVALAWDGATLRASTAHGLESFGSPVPEIFWRLVRRYGWYGLARCEAILRLADHRCSEEETGR